MRWNFSPTNLQLSAAAAELGFEWGALQDPHNGVEVFFHNFSWLFWEEGRAAHQPPGVLPSCQVHTRHKPPCRVGRRGFSQCRVWPDAPFRLTVFATKWPPIFSRLSPMIAATVGAEASCR
eukprot:GHVT01085798.1.p2 GENE.GHVT01085798.1~~GHVT01085798.1.p2  ORF type:complete len:121 (+),score=14.56 GHVT01085798.1:349-711(+)